MTVKASPTATDCCFSLQPCLAFVTAQSNFHQQNYVGNTAVCVNRMARWTDRNTWVCTGGGGGECDSLRYM